jgi:hydrogenase maturation protein HypF
MSKTQNAKLHITGIVQGVGFRPFIYSLAVRFGLKGWVKNTSAGVDIDVDGVEDVLKTFIDSIHSETPPLARIDSLDVNFGSVEGYHDFQIIHSESVVGAFQPISPDVSICPDCLREMLDPDDRRYHYPFINCTNCGPRFTIIDDIPYDRPNTTMSIFGMCQDCKREYSDPLDRRFHAQPVACPTCGPQVWLEDLSGTKISEKENAIIETQKLLREGKILAIKGLGGFHLACDATNPQSVMELRRRKLRVDKPFALMMASLAEVERHCEVNNKERELLESRQRPIVLLQKKSDTLIANDVAPGQNTLAVMLPYTPLHYLLFEDLKSENLAQDLVMPPLVMTSGNLSEEPIATDNDEARDRLTALADYLLMHNRDIRTRCDDSVARVLHIRNLKDIYGENQNSINKEVYFLRRSRGYAPDPIQMPIKAKPLLATGPEQKNTFCLTRDKYAFLSHHIGDMENYETLRSFEDGISHFERLFRIQPQALICDMHPDYLSTKYAIQRSQQEGYPLIRVQHHHAHIAACMVDNGLDGKHPVIGLAFDGTGYGEDGTIWGGEFLIADYSEFQRPFHFDYFPLPGGDAAIKRPARTALALLWHLGMDWEDYLTPVKALCFEERQALRIQLEHGLNTPKTSSLGRLFDAVASLAGIQQRVNYEAQAAIELEAAMDPTEAGAYPFDIRGNAVDLAPLFQALVSDIVSGISTPIISARFHNGLADLTGRICDKIKQETGINEIALSGGVWQNVALLEKTVRRLQKSGYSIYLHHQFPTNDGGVSVGQAIIGATKFDV